ncbi:putative transcription factor MYB-HB-like family [Helianthus debilis subsp. tardiflorus]
MPHRTSHTEDPTPPPPTVTLRRSPRFHQTAEPEDPKTPNPEPHRRTRSISTTTPLSLTGTEKLSPRRTRRSTSRKCSQKVDESVRTRRVNHCVGECDEDKLPGGSDRRRHGKSEKRITRSSCRDLDNTNHDSSSAEWTHEDGVNTSKQFNGKSPKNKVKHSKKNRDNDPDQFGALAIIKTQVLDEELSKIDKGRIENGVAVTTAVVVREGPVNVRDDVDEKLKIIGVKRTRTQFENVTEITHGWTKDQELALERAYLEAKPTPHFWKKVSRLVPGKSAQECFDKIHGSHMTPPQPRVRSRARVSNTQDPSLSASKLIKTSSPTKRPRCRKQKTHVVQRTVRHMLQNQYKVEHDSESDMFSLLEPTFNPSLNLNMVLTTPDRNQETNDVHNRSATVRRSVSRFSGLHGTTLVSPPVLKQVKNKALHEKYIDLLNCREANRKAASAKAAKVDKSKVVKQEGSVERKEAIKAAKNALVFGAKDAIDEFQHQQATALNDLFDYESGADDDEENDEVL